MLFVEVFMESCEMEVPKLGPAHERPKSRRQS